MKKIISAILLLILALQTAPLVYAWEIERPAGDIDIEERTENSCTNGEASVGIGVAIGHYIKRSTAYARAY